MQCGPQRGCGGTPTPPLQLRSKLGPDHRIQRPGPAPPRERLLHRLHGGRESCEVQERVLHSGVHHVPLPIHGCQPLIQRLPHARARKPGRDPPPVEEPLLGIRGVVGVRLGGAPRRRGRRRIPAAPGVAGPGGAAAAAGGVGIPRPCLLLRQTGRVTAAAALGLAGSAGTVRVDFPAPHREGWRRLPATGGAGADGAAGAAAGAGAGRRGTPRRAAAHLGTKPCGGAAAAAVLSVKQVEVLEARDNWHVADVRRVLHSRLHVLYVPNVRGGDALRCHDSWRDLDLRGVPELVGAVLLGPAGQRPIGLEREVQRLRQGAERPSRLEVFALAVLLGVPSLRGIAASSSCCGGARHCSLSADTGSAVPQTQLLQGTSATPAAGLEVGLGCALELLQRTRRVADIPGDVEGGQEVDVVH
mmetsp:Transcript_66539/g.184232  ORF Transcript_66539/g.184232 Transcript_66539/m.184232 type:complete len:416 (-) Transcript_66539:239-1486(-)